MNKLVNDLELKSKDIALYLVGYLNKNKSFKVRSFYGESFTLSLLNRHGLLDKNLKEILISEYKKLDKTDSQFHFEFNNYALSDLYQRNKDQEIRNLYWPLKFKGTFCTNWTMLRSNVRFIEKTDVGSAYKEMTQKISSLQMTNGLILDDVGVKSFQYHCFSAAMLLEIFETTSNEQALAAFTSAVEFIRKFILDNGEALYIGRGQEQSFGLGVLLYILSKYFVVTKNSSVLREMRLVLNYISKHQYATGAFPLVFTGLEKEVPANVQMHLPEFCGWYPYNNYFDYLPFLGFFLHKTYETLKDERFNEEIIEPFVENNIDFSDKMFIRAKREKYTAVLSCPGGYWTNDLPMPLILLNKQLVTPMLGGEQFQKSLYSPDSLSMPMTRVKNLSWRKYGKGFFWRNRLYWFSLFGCLCRSYKFKNDKIAINNYSLYWFPSEQAFSFLPGFERRNKELMYDQFKIKFSSVLNSITSGFSAMGELKVIKTKMNVKIVMEFKL
jgi:hypothetical protein